MPDARVHPLTGVARASRACRYEAQIRQGGRAGKIKSLGHYQTPEEAALAHARAKRQKNAMGSASQEDWIGSALREHAGMGSGPPPAALMPPGAIATAAAAAALTLLTAAAAAPAAAATSAELSQLPLVLGAVSSAEALGPVSAAEAAVAASHAAAAAPTPLEEVAAAAGTVTTSEEVVAVASTDVSSL